MIFTSDDKVYVVIKSVDEESDASFYEAVACFGKIDDTSNISVSLKLEKPEVGEAYLINRASINRHISDYIVISDWVKVSGKSGDSLNDN